MRNFDDILNSGFVRALEAHTMDDCLYTQADGTQIPTRVAVMRETVDQDIGIRQPGAQRISEVGQVRLTAALPVSTVPKPLRDETFTRLGISYRVVKTIERDFMRSVLLVEEIP